MEVLESVDGMQIDPSMRLIVSVRKLIEAVERIEASKILTRGMKDGSIGETRSIKTNLSICVVVDMF